MQTSLTYQPNHETGCVEVWTFGEIRVPARNHANVEKIADGEQIMLVEHPLPTAESILAMSERERVDGIQLNSPNELAQLRAAVQQLQVSQRGIAQAA